MFSLAELFEDSNSANFAAVIVTDTNLIDHLKFGDETCIEGFVPKLEPG